MQDTWIVGIDGSPSATTALRWAALNAAPRNSKVVALRAWHMPMPFKVLMTKRGVDVDRLGLAATAGSEIDEASTCDRFPDEVRAETTRLTTALDGVDPEQHAHRDIQLHSPQQALTAAMADAALVVVGGRGCGRGGPKMLGSVSTWILHETPCPVVVVPRRATG